MLSLIVACCSHHPEVQQLLAWRACFLLSVRCLCTVTPAVKVVRQTVQAAGLTLMPMQASDRDRIRRMVIAQLQPLRRHSMDQERPQPAVLRQQLQASVFFWCRSPI